MNVVSTVVISIVPSALLARVCRSRSRVTAVAAGLIAGGAIGNLADRVFRGDRVLRGAVIDFIDLQWFPIFNVADMAIDIGGALFVLWGLFGVALLHI